MRRSPLSRGPPWRYTREQQDYVWLRWGLGDVRVRKVKLEKVIEICKRGTGLFVSVMFLSTALLFTH